MTSPGIAAALKLSLMGYRFKVEGKSILADYQGQGKPDPAQVRPLLALVKEYKPEVLAYLGQEQETQNLGKCECGSLAWDTDAEGKPKCWCCLAIPGLFGMH
jgi:hypothetical protein